MEKRNATVAVIGAGDYIGAEIAKKFAAEGFTVFAGRRNGERKTRSRPFSMTPTGTRRWR
jgi:NAD(P)-dependent dehydrogenase (short-subunit alcohol dehydrogenase family)